MEEYEKETIVLFLFSNIPMIKKVNASVREHLTSDGIFFINCKFVPLTTFTLIQCTNRTRDY